MSIYISGPITGNPTYRHDFNAAEKSLRAAGHRYIYNPASDPLDPGAASWEAYMRRDLEIIITGGTIGICLLPGWENSRGARIEVDVAKALGIPVKTTSSWILTPPDPLREEYEPDDDDLYQGEIMQLKVHHYPVVVPLTPDEENDKTVTTWNKGDQIGTTEPARCTHKWARVETLPPFKECAECGETRIIHA